MLPFLSTGGANYDSVNGKNTVPSNSIQIDVKVPVQPSNFVVLQEGALMGAFLFMKYDKNHYNQCNYKPKTIPSPGTKFISTDLHGGPFLHSKSVKTNTSTIP
ncbi:hypothetical protein PT300_07630 [Enterobacteriaceae bacterium ESL0689]|nr:hypothetical protein [Enterobacteriaceae bacterium ESL0689]